MENVNDDEMQKIEILVQQVLIRLSNIDDNTKTMNGRLSLAESKINDIDRSQHLLARDIEYIKETVNKPKISWIQIASGIASICAVLAVLVAITNGTFGG